MRRKEQIGEYKSNDETKLHRAKCFAFQTTTYNSQYLASQRATYLTYHISCHLCLVVLFPAIPWLYRRSQYQHARSNNRHHGRQTQNPISSPRIISNRLRLIHSPRPRSRYTTTTLCPTRPPTGTTQAPNLPRTLCPTLRTVLRRRRRRRRYQRHNHRLPITNNRATRRRRTVASNAVTTYTTAWTAGVEGGAGVETGGTTFSHNTS